MITVKGQLVRVLLVRLSVSLLRGSNQDLLHEEGRHRAPIPSGEPIEAIHHFSMHNGLDACTRPMQGTSRTNALFNQGHAEMQTIHCALQTIIAQHAEQDLFGNSS
eukprot:5905130-Amphidinium_carterae.1